MKNTKDIETAKTLSQKLIWIAPIFLLGFALLPLPYFYYQLMRWVICGCAVLIAFKLFEVKEGNWIISLFAFIAIFYNPIAPIHLFREAWMVLNITAAVCFGYGFYRYTVS